MKVIKGNLFAQDCEAIVIPITGYVERGDIDVSPLVEPISLLAKEQWKSLPLIVANRVTRTGMCVQTTGGSDEKKAKDAPYYIILFPTRPGRVYPEEVGWEKVTPKFRNEPFVGPVPGHMCMADIKIITHSLEELVELTSERKWRKVCLPRLGQGEGGLPWDEVLTLMHEHLDKRFVVVSDE